MLEEIAIENLGVIRSARVPLGSGLTVITGETGAGKTMVLTGLGLLMGGKADPATVRPGAATAVVEGRVRVADRPAVARRVDDAGGAVDDDGTVLVLRSVAAEGRSRAHLGGRSVPQGVLAELADELVTVHGQADQLRLRTASKQREALDAFAGPQHRDLVERYRATWTERGALQAEIDDLTARAGERAREAELLRLGLAEVERIDPRPGEDAELAALVARLGNVEELRVAAQVAHDAVAGDDDAEPQANAVTAVERARRALETAAASDPALAPLVERLAEVSYVLADVATEVSGYVEDLAADPAGLETAHARLAELGTLTRSYGETVDDVLAWASDAGLRLLDLDDGGERLRAATARRDELDEELVRVGEAMTASRERAGAELAGAVTEELRGLAMGGSSLVVDVAPADEPGPWGADTVTFSLVAHPGAPPRPLGKRASGGELSRVMLAIEVALATSAAGADGPALPTFVFDEVDAGVGGRAAVEVGRRLGALARRTQVVVVTHLAQVAAFADVQLVVTKSTPGASEDDAPVVVTGVQEVTGDARVRELARMLSGQEDSDAALRHAHELLESSVVGR
ncbi:DNA repair protein RecN [Cellulosimicrobium marinum]|uniref:DNA repair protein RecN n=1 Tax=Cellulosimicrobium marinum TaxID=1638992 RepID=UPI001E5B4411|nr:DNA repair protein RecN [Cellulosimicrobium marinum]MCB7138161.1 DNA repair protein RecN [Cellulosimicrobium marinum]